MKYALLLSGIVEVLGGLVVYFSPILAFPSMSVEAAHMYGLAAMVIGLINIFAYKSFGANPIFKHIFLSMMFFHAAVSFIIYSAPQGFISHKIGGILVHLSLFLVFTFTYLKDLKPD